MEDLSHNIPARLDAFCRFHRQTLDHREQFWAGQARQLQWQNDFTCVVQEDLSIPRASWFCDGRINAAENALHRIIEKGLGGKKALICYHQSGTKTCLSFNELKEKALILAAAFRQNGLVTGDCIALNLAGGPEFVICALAAAWLGITYLPVGRHLPASVVAEDVTASRSKLVIMGNRAAFKEDADHARRVHGLLPSHPLIIAGGALEGLDTLEAYTANADPTGLAPASPPADLPLFAIYENRLAGNKHVGSVFSTAGFLVQAHASFDAIFHQTLTRDQPEMIVNTLDISKAPAHAYGLWGPLTNGTGIIFIENRPNEEAVDTGTLETILHEHSNPAMLCRPSLISDIRDQLGSGRLNTERRFSILACCSDALPPRLVSYAGETLVEAPERVVNMWVQAKSGTALLHAYPTPELNRPGSLGFGAPGVEPLIMSDFGEACKTNISGNLVFDKSWPAMAKATFGTSKHFKKTYFSRFPGHFLTYDGVRSDKNGFFWFMGRLDDVIKVKGQTLGASLIETVLSSLMFIDEAAIISGSGPAGQDAVLFVVARGHVENKERYITQINTHIAEKIGHFAVPEKIIFTDQLPRTATGKLFRTQLRRIASDNVSDSVDAPQSTAGNQTGV